MTESITRLGQGLQGERQVLEGSLGGMCSMVGVRRMFASGICCAITLSKHIHKKTTAPGTVTWAVVGKAPCWCGQ